MIEAAVTPADAQQFRILIKSVGTARPSASAAVAKGLGLPASTVIARLYRAPAVLVDGIDEPVAERMAGFLGEIGYEAEVQGMSEPAPVPAPLNDVAVYIEDARQFQQVVEKLASFLGVAEPDASRLILAPPGVVLGSVSDATVNAFSEHMGAGVSILSSQPGKACYDLFVSAEKGMVQSRILADMASASLEFCGDDGLMAVNVNHSSAQDLWRRHQASGLLRVVNQDFLRFDLVLCEAGEACEPVQRQVEILERLAGVPSKLVAEVLNSAPITLLESVPSADVSAHMEEFAEAGIKVRADLITFQVLGLEVLEISDIPRLKKVLEDLELLQPGEPLPRAPFMLPGVMPELQARVTRAALEDCGARIALVEVS